MGVIIESDGKSRRGAVKRLLEAVKNDLEICDREKIEKGIREEGFWRWAGRNAWNNMQLVREELDWATGQRKESGREGLGRAQSGGSGAEKPPDPEPDGLAIAPKVKKAVTLKIAKAKQEKPTPTLELKPKPSTVWKTTWAAPKAAKKSVLREIYNVPDINTVDESEAGEESATKDIFAEEEYATSLNIFTTESSGYFDRSVCKPEPQPQPELTGSDGEWTVVGKKGKKGKKRGSVF